MIALIVFACLAEATVSGMRWLRVAQREHYLAGSTTRFAIRWWTSSGPNRLLGAAAVVGAVLSVFRPLPGAVAAAAAAAGPFGLGLNGRTSALAWTRRMKTLAAVWGFLTITITAIGFAAGSALGAIVAAVFVPVVIDLALVITRPIEERQAQQFVDKAKERLQQVSPTIVGITGSYGKTTTKGYVAHLVGSNRQVVASPASFNNRAGLSRAINENLVPGTDVFVAEMGTYGKGEIAALCEWVPPTIGVITAIGPVHLERFGSEERIVEAKRELVDAAQVAVLNVEDDRLRALAYDLVGKGKRVIRCSATDTTADVSAVTEGSEVVIRLQGQRIGSYPVGAAQPTNVACAVAVAGLLDVPDETIGSRLAGLPTAPNRLTVSKTDYGTTIIDDTFNSNPAGAAAALALLARSAPEGKRVVVTPGMVELGSRQRDANIAFAAAAAQTADRLVIVGHTNRAALQEGATRGRATVVCVEHREQATAWVREHVSEGDAVLYENDLPDHYP